MCVGCVNSVGGSTPTGVQASGGQPRNRQLQRVARADVAASDSSVDTDSRDDGTGGDDGGTDDEAVLHDIVYAAGP